MKSVNLKKQALAKQTLVGAVSIIAMTIAAGTAAAQAEEVAFDIKQQSLSKALLEFNEQSGRSVAAPIHLVEGKTAPAVNGEMLPEEALEKLLSASGLRLKPTPSGDAFTVTLASASLGEETPPQPFRVAQLDQEEDVREIARDVETADAERREDVIVVTGTNIRGAAPVGSPVFVFDREAIDSSGFATPGEFLRSIPQNSGAGQSEIVARNSSGGASNTHGDSANLRNLGPGSTLTLVNGYRLAPSVEGNTVDISLIPLSAIERVEVLTDGASAIYGSDAVAGVVNFVLRKDFDGAETRLRYGNVTSGEASEYQASQTIGTTWKSGNILGAYEYYRRNSLSAGSRSFTENAAEPFELLPEQERNSVFVAGSQSLSPQLELFGNFFYSDRQSEQATNINSGTAPTIVSSQNEQVGGVAALSYDINSNWQANVAALINKTTHSFDTFSVIPQTTVSDAEQSSQIWSIDAKIDGSIASLPAGDLKLAIGANYREEEMEVTNLLLTPPSVVRETDRDVIAVFGELLVPLINSENPDSIIDRLEVSAAVRYENYSDVGETTNPKFGVGLTVFDDLSLRGSYSSSFRAPSMFQLDTTGSTSTIVNLPNSSGMFVPVFLAFGTSPELGPEEADTWTAGIDYQPSQLPGFDASITYFNVEYTDRIGNAFSSFFNVFSEGELAGPAFVLNPSTAFLDDRIAESDVFFNVFNIPLGDIEAFADFRTQNLSETSLKGLDFAISYEFDDVFDGKLGVSAGGQYLIDDIRRVTPASPGNDVLNTVFNSPDLKLRNGVSWSGTNLTANVAFNYVTDYRDIRGATVNKVDAFFTTDLTLAYNTRQNSALPLLSDLSLSLSVLNLFDEDPPFVDDTVNNLNFDGANASPLGRFVALRVGKSW